MPESKNNVLHIVNKSGGGTMRYIESITYSQASNFRHFIWYVGINQSVIFDVKEGFYYAFSANLSTNEQHQVVMTVLHNAGIKKIAVHLHSASGAGLIVAEKWLKKTQKTDHPVLTVTLHDHHFLAERPFQNGELSKNKSHIERIQRIFKKAEILLPSKYLLQQVLPYFRVEQLHVIPHGADEPVTNLDPITIDFINSLKARADWDRDTLTVATIGAISEDKGLSFMKDWLSQRGDTQFLCLGYTADEPADKIRPKASPSQITHGFYHHKEVPELLEAYDVDIVVFFPGIAESFCYALSDVHAALPVLAPNKGALGERVTNEKLGHVYAPGITPKQLNDEIVQLAELNMSPNNQPQSVETMTLETEKLYRLYAPDEILALSLPHDELSALLDNQLHDDNLKWELATLVRQYDASNEEVKFLKSETVKQNEYIGELKQNVWDAQAQAERLNRELHEVHNTLSWKITKPIRLIRQLLK